MATIERAFFRTYRGPAPGNADEWRLVFDPRRAGLQVRHEWHAERHSGVDDVEIGEFLAEPGAARTALLRLLFGEAMADAY